MSGALASFNIAGRTLALAYQILGEDRSVVYPGEHNVLRPVGPQSGQIEWLYWMIFWICFVVFVLVIAAFARGAARSRVPPGEPGPIIREDAADRRASWAVGTAVAITVVTLFVILGTSVA